MSKHEPLSPVETPEEENFPVFPMFLMVDVSYSMENAPIDAVNEALPELKEVAAEDHTVGEVARVGLMTFAGSARTDMPLSDLKFVTMPTLALRQDGTNFAAALKHAKTEISDSIKALGKGTRFFRPVLFFITDGEHNARDSWQEPLSELRSKENGLRPEIVAIGFNEAREQELRQIATTYCLLAKPELPIATQVKEIFALIIRSIQTNSRSATDAATTGGAAQFTLEPNPDKFALLEPMIVSE
jgi:uncharacterized protein YegL